MVDARRLLADLKKLRKRLEDDLRRYHATSTARTGVEAEWQEARDTRRTADTFESFFSAALDQAAVHWILAIVFLRFLEDNRLLDRPLISGIGERVELAQLRQRDYFRRRPTDSDAEYLLTVFEEMRAIPGLAGLYDSEHNPLFRLPVSGDGAIALFDFFRQRSAETGELVHDFTDVSWNTRFLGDLYQDLSEEARKRFALLQTPTFIEEWILSRTLDPAIIEFGYDQVRMIDPTCGSGHFLLGGFTRLLAEWQHHAPDMPPSAQAQNALDGVAGVDLNPFAVEIARFRLLVAALKVSGETRLAAAPDFRVQLATGDSLLHGRHFTRHELGGANEGFGRVLRHHFNAEDTTRLESILGRQYHAVVGNPPYITPKDAAMRDAYREIYDSCYMKYSLGAPFIERFFDLTQRASDRNAAGFVGLIVGNNFMKREFGKKLIETVLPQYDLTHIIDASSTHIPGHTTPTAILFGRNRPPILRTVRTVRVVSGAPEIPEIRDGGKVWQEIVALVDIAGSIGEFISSEDTPREALTHHPWNMGGGGAAEVQARIEGERRRLVEISSAVGIFGMTNADKSMLATQEAFGRFGCEDEALRPLVVGDAVREWRLLYVNPAIFPYTGHDLISLDKIPAIGRWLWPVRTTMGNRATFNQKTYFEEGRAWWEWHQVTIGRLGGYAITFGEIATHNHFVLDRGGHVFSQTAPIIKLRGASENDYLGVLGLLNSSTGCFWLKQVMANKGGGGIGGGLKSEYWDRIFVFNATKVERFPLSAERPVEIARALDNAAQNLAGKLPATVCAGAVPSRHSLDAARAETDIIRARMVALQEELDWRCYGLYGLLEDPPEHPNPPPLQLGERAFEIVMARRIRNGELKTAWFERHACTPITELPGHWAADYTEIVERRIALIESDLCVGLIEKPEYKRRWSSESWEAMERDSLRKWLLDRLEDRRLWSKDEPRILSTRALSDALRKDWDFVRVAELFVGRSGFELESLVAELIAGDSMPFLAALRYTETGLRKRYDWEVTWNRQRQEDAIDAELAGQRGDFLRAAWARMNERGPDEPAETYAARMIRGLDDVAVQKLADFELSAEARRRKREEIGDIPVPPKYKPADFVSHNFWRLRDGLDVPKERFVSFPQCARTPDPTLPVLWAGFDYLARAKAIAAWYVDRKEIDGWEGPRLQPMLAGILELVPWLRQWHNEVDPDTGLRMGDYFAGYVEEEARGLGVTLDDLQSWTPPAPTRKAHRRRVKA